MERERRDEVRVSCVMTFGRILNNARCGYPEDIRARILEKDFVPVDSLTRTSVQNSVNGVQPKQLAG